MSPTARARLLALAAGCVLGCSGCEAERPSGAADAAAGSPDAGETLDALGLFEDAPAQSPAPGVLPYDVIAVLYADESEKLRFLSIPADAPARYEATEPWTFPDGTIFVKTFFFWNDARDPSLGRRLLETRIIERVEGRWTGRTYVWNEAQSEARRLKTGRMLEVRFVDASGESRALEYRVPNDNECKTCHSKDHVFEPLGPRTRQLDREHDYGGELGVRNQIDHLAALGSLEGVEPAERVALVDPYGSAPLEQRARSYLEANCSHCHRPGGEAGSSALDLRVEVEVPFDLGVCRRPVAAGPGSGGRLFDIVPGDPEASIMIYRMDSTDPEIKMPELPTLSSDAHGTTLIRDWIAAMPSEACR